MGVGECSLKRGFKKKENLKSGWHILTVLNSTRLKYKIADTIPNMRFYF